MAKKPEQPDEQLSDDEELVRKAMTRYRDAIDKKLEADMPECKDRVREGIYRRLKEDDTTGKKPSGGRHV